MKWQSKGLLLLPFFVTITLSSALLILVEPLISKHILPQFGGASTVWISANIFFQFMLMIGYAYAFFLSKLKLSTALCVHILLILLAIFTGANPLRIPINVNFQNPPLLSIILYFTQSIGLTFFLLSSTSTLIQLWYSRLTRHKNPYKLYIYSNIGSLGGLLLYPFLIEPLLSLNAQANIWVYGFVFYSVLLILGGLLALRTKPLSVTTKTFNLNHKNTVLWLGISALTSAFLLSATVQITKSVAPVPLLWLIPLGVYLLSFVFAFSDKNWGSGQRIPSIFIFLISIVIFLGFNVTKVPLLLTLTVYTLALFMGFLFVHKHLYSLRPHKKNLASFYFLTSLGSFFGGIFVGIIAPLVFKTYIEFYLIVFCLYFLALIQIANSKKSWVSSRIGKKIFQTKRDFWIIGTAVFISIFMVQPLREKSLFIKSNDKTYRNFYGVLSVKEDGDTKQLISGSVLHGYQYQNQDSKIPTTYYGSKSGVGKLLSNPSYQFKRVGAVGLGVGTIATYSKEGDIYRFYEINPKVLEIANNDFSYLKEAKGKIEVKLIDGRLGVSNDIKVQKPKFDLLVLDAFTDDSIPTHLLTKEAFEIYLESLNENGIIAVHISNNYLDLKPVIRGLAQYFNLKMSGSTNFDRDETNTPSQWALLSKADLPQGFEDQGYSLEGNALLWRDNWSPIVQIMK